jgi:hypothetical protein
VRWFVSGNVTRSVPGHPTNPGPFDYTVYLYHGNTELASAAQHVATPPIPGEFITTPFVAPVPITPGAFYTVVVRQTTPVTYYPYDTGAGVVTACGVTLSFPEYGYGPGLPGIPGKFYGIEPVVTSTLLGTE